MMKGTRGFPKCLVKQYTAPEVLEGRQLTKKAEVYSFGVIMWEAWHSRLFTMHDAQMMRNCRCAL